MGQRMKIGFSSLVCPDWDLQTIVAKAAHYQFDGIELRGLKGELRLPLVPELAGNPGATRQAFEAATVELVCLASSCTFSSRDRTVLGRQRQELAEYLELAGKLGCPFVRLFVGEIPKGRTRDETLQQVAEELSKVASLAAEQRVTLLISNGGDFPGSADLWYLCDCLAHPAIRVCWNPCPAWVLGERPTTSIPRLGTKIGMVHACDADFGATGFPAAYKVPGTGEVGWERAIELLRGLFYRDYLIFEWPRLWDPSLPAADQVLPEVATFLRGRIQAKQPILTAYKGDKNAPSFKSPPLRPVARGA